MQFSLARGGSVRKQFAEALITQLREGAERLEDASHDRAEAVHEARVAVKRVRSAIRLIEHADPEGAGALHAEIRAVSTSLAGERDADALLELVSYLDTHEANSRREHEALGALRAQIEADQPALAILGANAASALRASAERVGDWARRCVTRRRLARGYRRGLDRATRAAARWADEPSTESLHRWRRRTKDHRYQTRLLAKIGGRRLHRRARALRTLGQGLGVAHDLTLLLVRDDAAMGSDPPAVRELASRALDRATNEALVLGRTLFGADSDRAARRVERRLRR